ncbi:AraC family transcriptional regulator [Mucilaginibacter sp. 21P]|uniref:helix-turn-helix domain-containing protein n=1 Tax=Mucilaginibacter sp. 21P TaxID=2778902 RepID=UPI001C592CF4|nr:helix-turn-helix domain-containing protein [Mucilaginibacter sp. 21P]QXV63953.1 AraC family transcriptional regulator [Mucilaginibacter sp. 21P]
MAKNKSNIPVYHLHERAVRSFQLFDLVSPTDVSHWDQAHRDDNYLFLFQRTGSTRMMVDFKEVTVDGCAIYCILPGQVHYGIDTTGLSACVLAADPSIVPENYRNAFAEFAFGNVPVIVSEEKAVLLQSSLNLLGKIDLHFEDLREDRTPDHMLDVCISLFAGICQASKGPGPASTLRPQLITRQFRSLLLLRFREMKSPSEYAAALNVSASYLNEVVKNTTGFPLSYWIHQEIILEAKRQLFYTDTTVKELSHLLGYTDTTYFIRLFGKTTGMSPLEFRSKYRK